MGKIFAIAAKSCVAGSFTMIYIFASELYPTEIRSIGISFGSAVGCLSAAFIFPKLLVLKSFNGYLTHLIFGIVGVVFSLPTFKIPETAKLSVKQTISETERQFI